MQYINSSVIVICILIDGLSGPLKTQFLYVIDACYTLVVSQTNSRDQMKYLLTITNHVGIVKYGIMYV